MKPARSLAGIILALYLYGLETPIFLTVSQIIGRMVWLFSPYSYMLQRTKANHAVFINEGEIRFVYNVKHE